MSSRTALVIGASGITGWALLREALAYPSGTAFQRVIALFNRPTNLSDMLLPTDDRITLASGFDLTKNADDIVTGLQAVEGIQDVTDVYFAAYYQPPGTSDFEGFEILKAVNVRMLETAVYAVERSCPRLQFWTLQTGGKSYGFVHAMQIGLPKVPCKESDPRIPQPFEDQVFYYAQHDALKKLSEGKPWRFAEIRPDLVIGFVPSGRNAMNFAQALGVYLSFYADREPEVSGKKEIPFPGTTASYVATHTEVGQTTLARAHIFVSGLSDTASGEIYNVGDSPLTTPVSWKEKWAAVCAYFGLQGVGPDETTARLSVVSYMQQHQGEAAAFEEKYGLRPGIVSSCSWEFLEVLLSLATFDRHFDLSKFDAAGFHERADLIQNYIDTFELMKNAKIIPARIVPGK